jgi:hypothetical protein
VESGVTTATSPADSTNAASREADWTNGTEGDEYTRLSEALKAIPKTASVLDLQAVVAAWPELPEALRAGIVAIVQSGKTGSEKR